MLSSVVDNRNHAHTARDLGRPIAVDDLIPINARLRVRDERAQCLADVGHEQFLIIDDDGPRFLGRVPVAERIAVVEGETLLETLGGSYLFGAVELR